MAGGTLEGKRVCLRGITSAAHVALEGTVIESCGEFDPVTRRYSITLPDGRTLAMSAARVEAAGLQDAALNRCANVACESLGTNQCSGCLLVSYCGAACQRANWKAHKTACRAAALAGTVVLRIPPTSTNRSFSRESRSTGERRVGLEFDVDALRTALKGGVLGGILKIQPILGGESPGAMAYDKTGTFTFSIARASGTSADSGAEALLSAVLAAGKHTQFYPFMIRSCAAGTAVGGGGLLELVVGLSPSPPQTW
jgi:hypothetical protein